MRYFLDNALDQATPGDSTISTRRLFWLSTDQAVFRWVLTPLACEAHMEGITVGVDATTLVANAAMRPLVRRSPGSPYDGFVKQLAGTAGLEHATPEQIAL